MIKQNKRNWAREIRERIKLRKEIWCANNRGSRGGNFQENLLQCCGWKSRSKTLILTIVIGNSHKLGIVFYLWLVLNIPLTQRSPVVSDLYRLESKLTCFPRVATSNGGLQQLCRYGDISDIAECRNHSVNKNENPIQCLWELWTAGYSYYTPTATLLV